MTEKDRIRRLVLVEGKSIRQVAKETGRSRNTITKMLADSEPPRYQRAVEKPTPVLGPFTALIDRWIAEDEKKPKKKRRTARRMYDILRAEPYGYQGAESTLRRYVGLARRQTRHKVFVLLDYQAGEAAQLDFGETDVIVADQRVVAQLFLMWLGHSSATFMKAYPAQTQEIFFDGHAAAFAFFGGVPRQVWYDNLKVAVAKVLRGRNRQEQEAFISLRSHYLFEAHFCNTAAGWEKGGVEGRVGYGRRNWLVPVQEFPSWTALNDYLAEQCRLEWSRRLKGRGQTIGELLAAERAQFLPLPEQPFPCCKTEPVKANHLSLVTYATNRYSIPVEHAHESLLLRAFVDRIEVTNGRQIVATHPRCWDRERDILDPLHFLGLLARRPRAFTQAKAIRQWRETWPPVFDRYWTVLQDRLPEAEWSTTFIRILQLCATYPEETLARVLEVALSHHCYSYDGVRELLRRQTEPAPPAPVNLADRPDLRQVHVDLPDLAQFNRLLPTGGVS
ncbi:MAG: IS21 family transposase [Ardenticatenaceae bacterium]|nr:IS21 family transposase [Ardenticatenaceae bacterium]MCB8985597.1 IS21 family transposase [Ardenticatenaceae bacterium]MCB8985817.1 IS21 family transposase [Ardenticatenaceae bacterium]